MRFKDGFVLCAEEEVLQVAQRTGGETAARKAKKGSEKRKGEGTVENR